MKAFPQKYPIDANEPHHWIDNPLDRGMDLRDYFAAKVMQGIISAIGHKFVEKPDYLEISKESYKFADSMIGARNATK